MGSAALALLSMVVALVQPKRAQLRKISDKKRSVMKISKKEAVNNTALLFYKTDYNNPLRIWHVVTVARFFRPNGFAIGDVFVPGGVTKAVIDFLHGNTVRNRADNFA